MFAGHFAVALAAKRLAPRASLGVLVAAAQLLDLAWPLLVLLGVEQVRVEPLAPPFLRLDFVAYPFTHGAVPVLLWAALAGLAYRWRAGDRAGAWTVAGLVLSHWLLDALTHRPDLPLWPGGPKVGLGLWESTGWTVAVEAALLAAGALVYVRTTRRRDEAGRLGLYAFLAFLVVVSASSVLGPPPPSDAAVALAGLSLWLLVPWAAWVDRHRTVRETIGRPAGEL
ncbi:MAG TPA: hypothetical protein VFP50_12820 [Anaeromyxobacteraceae bacterium]|nr:hypothetical protein [Anaeromyxobacteraceae bacterium]